MDMLPSLCAAMVRANGDSLVLESGRAPYVVAGTQRQDVAKATLSNNALEALVSQIFSEPGRQAFKESGFASEDVDVPSAGLMLSATVLKSDDGISIELKRAPAAALLESVPVQLSGEDDDSLLAPPEQMLTTAESLGDWEPSPGIFVEPAADDAGEIPWTPDAATAPAAAATVVAGAADAPPDELWAQVEFDRASEASTSSPTAAAMPNHDSFASPKPAPVSRSQSWAQAPAGDLMAWASDAADKGATTIYLRAGSQPVVRVDERLDSIGSNVLDEAAMSQLIGDLEDGGDQSWQRGAEGEWVRLDARLGRVTCRLFSDDEGRGLIMRLHPSAAARGLHRLVPRKVKAACDGDGLILVSGTTTDEALALAGSVADLAAQRRGGYVVALRPDGAQRPQLSGSFVSQREFAPAEAAAAIRAAVAESPDILLVAMPQAEGTGREIARASEGGRLVVLAMAAPTSLQAVRSLIGRGSSVNDAQVRLSLAGSFRAAFATRTLRRLGGGRTTVQDLLLGTSEVSSLIASGDFAGATRLQRQGLSGMYTIDERLARGVRRGHLPLRQAAENALDRRHLVSLVRSAGRTAREAAPEEQLQPVGASRSSKSTRWS
jgi:Tfp pilus assembly pilus retraction ATPase PilT